jgi:hypothetical protein
MIIALALLAAQDLPQHLSTIAHDIATLTIIGLMVGLSAAGKASRLMLSLTWTFAQAVFANHFGDHLVEQFRRPCRSPRPNSLHNSGAAVLIRATTHNGTVIEIRTDDVAAAQAIVPEVSRYLSAPR